LAAGTNGGFLFAQNTAISSRQTSGVPTAAFRLRRVFLQGTSERAHARPNGRTFAWSRHYCKAMKNNALFRYTLLSLAALVASPALFAQQLLELKLEQYCKYASDTLETELYRFPNSDKADSLIREVLELGEAYANFEWVQTNVPSVVAVLDGEKRYLLYSLDFIEKHNTLEVFATLAHEIGHHALGHTFSAERREIEELEADRFMGFVLSNKGFSMPDIGWFLEKWPSPYRASITQRQIAVEEGQEVADRIRKTKSLPYTSAPMTEDITLPKFPWPPPACHARFELPKAVFSARKTLGGVEDKLRAALEAKGYGQRSYFSVPNGFAIVTQLEQYNGADGSVRTGNTRWLDYPAKESFAGLVDYLTSLVMPQKGYFRLFVLVVTDQPFGGSAQRVSKEQATAWLGQGFNKLPNSLAELPFTTAYDVTALVYEFEVPESNRKPVQKCPTPRFNAKTHLQKSGMAAQLGF